QRDRTACWLTRANEREKIECTKIHESNLSNALLLVRKPDQPPAAPPDTLRLGARFATLRGQSAKPGIIAGRNLWRQKVLLKIHCIFKHL
ncbi:hypothetical protein, partial [Trinickia symbiotica]|uniref:hypothetical protein n=3 Tax=Pseudomonadota TaxID=1224 RepID=UPI001CB99940